MRYVRQPEGLAPPLGRYSHVSMSTGTEIVAVAGQIGVTPDGALAGDGTLRDQVKQAFANIGIALSAVDLDPSNVLKFTTFLVDASAIDEFMHARTEAYADMYPTGAYPPNTLLVVQRLVEERFLVEIEALAVRHQP